MANKGKKDSGGGGAANGRAKVLEGPGEDAEPVAKASPALVPTAAHAANGHVAARAPVIVHGHKPNIKEYLVIFVILAALTLIEVVLAQMGISKKLLGVALVGLAVTKAAIVGLYYMHLKSETRVLKLTVAVPLAAPTIYALVLITEAAWRLTR